MKAPIIVHGDGILDIYESVADAALAMEAIDVLNQEYSVYDCEGTVLQLYAPSRTSTSLEELLMLPNARVDIRMLPNAKQEPARLRHILWNFVRRVGPERFSISEDELGEANLSTLIDLILRF